MLRVESVSKSFGGEAVLSAVSFEVAEGKTLAVLGRSGCGKTTLLRIVAGLLPADAGRVEAGGRDVTDAPAQRRGVVYLRQEPLLFPHLSVFENVAFGLRVRKAPEADVRRRVEALLRRLELPGLAERRPHELSGGQRQRVAFGRALVVEPSVLLLDEPFGSLDEATRSAMQELFRAVTHEARITSVFVTHGLREALTMGDAVATLAGGVLHGWPSVREFVADPRSGAREEIAFWTRWGETDG